MGRDTFQVGQMSAHCNVSLCSSAAQDPQWISTFVAVMCNKLHRLTKRDSRLAYSFGLLWGLELLLGYFATSDAKSEIIFFLGDPDFLQR